MHQESTPDILTTSETCFEERGRRGRRRGRERERKKRATEGEKLHQNDGSRHRLESDCGWSVLLGIRQLLWKGPVHPRKNELVSMLSGGFAPEFHSAQQGKRISSWGCAELCSHVSERE